ncbi:alpha/beta hydrolase family protein [Streptomyces kanasensis]|uniref:alpha/beta hydrolase family protein n=1 Tax=Streptomyces kanasensis TaxID=936756 RepID=UPI003702EEC4
MKTSRTLRSAAAAALLVTLAATATAPAAQAHTPGAGASAAALTAGASATAAPVLRQAAPDSPAVVGVVLPRPTGPSAVGRSTLHLVDRSRQDPWVPDRPRELMVDVYHPARSAAGAPAPYADPREARLLLEAAGNRDAEAAARLGATLTHSVAGARPQGGRHPLVLLSPGFGAPRFTLTTLAEEYASRGYVVAVVDHAYEAAGAVFPGGRVLTCVACEKAQTWEDMRKATVNRGRDLSFVVDRLTGPRPAWRYARMIDRKRMGAAGHSIGGAAAASVMARDERVRAGVNMDGSFGDPVPAGGLGGRPFLMLGTQDEVHLPGGGDPTWDEAWRHLDGWKRWLGVSGAHHFTFSDVPVLFDQLGVAYPGDQPQPTIAAGRAVELTRAYTTAFFDRHLRGRPQPLLDGPTAQNPEVHFNGDAR